MRNPHVNPALLAVLNGFSHSVPEMPFPKPQERTPHDAEEERRHIEAAKQLIESIKQQAEGKE
jgi:hypothetical protein